MCAAGHARPRARAPSRTGSSRTRGAARADTRHRLAAHRGSGWLGGWCAVGAPQALRRSLRGETLDSYVCAAVQHTQRAARRLAPMPRAAVPAHSEKRARRQSETFVDESVTQGPSQQKSTTDVATPMNLPDVQHYRSPGLEAQQQIIQDKQVRVRSAERSRRPSEYHRMGYVTLGQPLGMPLPGHKVPELAPVCCARCARCDQLCGFVGDHDAGPEPLWKVFLQRIPWLIGLMMVQSVSSVVLQRYEDLIEANVIIASYLTMLVGGGGNAAVQVVTDIVRRNAKTQSVTFAGTLARELAVSCAIAPTLAVVAYLRVRYLGVRATKLDALAIALSYCTIIVVAVATAVLVTFILQYVGKSRLAATGAAPTTQVLVDVLGIVVVCLICMALLGVNAPADYCEQCTVLGGVECIDASRCNTTDSY